MIELRTGGYNSQFYKKALLVVRQEEACCLPSTGPQDLAQISEGAKTKSGEEEF